MKALVVIIGLLAIFAILPIQFYLQYQLLARVHATELMWFLFWVHVPLVLLMHVISKIAEKVK